MNYTNVSCSAFHGNFSELLGFKVAFHFAEQGFNVLFVSPEQIKELPNALEFPDREALKLMTFMYVNDIKVLLEQINSVYMWHKKPQIIIINNFDYYLNTVLQLQDKVAFIISNILSAVIACADILEKKVNLFYIFNGLIEENISNIFINLYRFKVIKLNRLTDENFNEILIKIVKDE